MRLLPFFPGGCSAPRVPRLRLPGHSATHAPRVRGHRPRVPHSSHAGGGDPRSPVCEGWPDAPCGGGLRHGRWRLTRPDLPPAHPMTSCSTISVSCVFIRSQLYVAIFSFDILEVENWVGRPLPPLRKIRLATLHPNSVVPTSMIYSPQGRENGYTQPRVAKIITQPSETRV